MTQSLQPSLRIVTGSDTPPALQIAAEETAASSDPVVKRFRAPKCVDETSAYLAPSRPEWFNADPFAPCMGCGWTPFQGQFHKGYKSRHKLSYVGNTTAIWSLGQAVMMKDKVHCDNSSEVENMRFVKGLGGKLSGLVPRLVHDWVEGDRHFIIQERVKGRSLEDVWGRLGDEQKEGIARDTAEAIAELRPFTSKLAMNISGKALRDSALVLGGIDTVGPLSTDEELWEAIEKSLLRADPVDCQRLRQHMPSSAPFTFSHGDLSVGNIIVSDEGRLAGIVDWEHGGYYPAWFEYARNSMSSSDADAQWKQILQKHMKGHDTGYEEGKVWWRMYRALVKLPDEEETAEMMREFEEYFGHPRLKVAEI